MSGKNINLDKINDYLVSFKTHTEEGNVYKIFEIRFPNNNIKWNVFNGKDIFIETTNNGITYLVFSINPKVQYDDLVKHIEKIIVFNLEKEEKFTLYQIKMNELNDLFDELDLKTLQTLSFKYKGQKKKKIEEVIVEEPIIDNVQTYDETTTINTISSSENDNNDIEKEGK